MHGHLHLSPGEDAAEEQTTSLLSVCNSHTSGTWPGGVGAKVVLLPVRPSPAVGFVLPLLVLKSACAVALSASGIQELVYFIF